MITLIGIFAAATVLWLCYWSVVRTFILDSVEDELRRMDSQLEWAMIEGVSGAQSESAQVLQKSLKLYKTARWISISQVIWTLRSNPAEVKALRVKVGEIFKTAPAWVKDMKHRQEVLAMKSALANSPSWWIPLAAVLLFAFFSKTVEQFWKDTEMATAGLNCPA